MAYLIVDLIALALVIGFFVLSNYEAQKGVRVFAEKRVRLDAQVARATFILTHVNFGSFLREEISNLAHRIAHDIAHVSLQVVRVIERVLTHLVRYLRAQRATDTVPHENAREFVKVLSDFKGHLETTHPDVPDVLN